jgi:flagellar protein FlbD
MTPDTVISLTTGEKIMVLESSDELVEKVLNFRRSISGNCGSVPVANSVPSGEPDGGR